MCYIWCGIFPMDFTTTIDIVPQSVAFLLQSVVLPMNFPKTNCSIVLQHIIVYHKNSSSSSSLLSIRLVLPLAVLLI